MEILCQVCVCFHFCSVGELTGVSDALQWPCVVVPCRTFSLFDGVVFLLDLSQVGPHADERLMDRVLCFVPALLSSCSPAFFPFFSFLYFSLLDPGFFSRFRYFLALFFGCFYCASEDRRRFFGYQAESMVQWLRYCALCWFSCVCCHPAVPRLFPAIGFSDGELLPSPGSVANWRPSEVGGGEEEELRLFPSILTLALASRVLFCLDLFFLLLFF